MPPKTVAVIGANRGLGLEFVKQFIHSSTPPEILFATCRQPEQATELNRLASSAKGTKLRILRLDVCNENEINTVASTIVAETEEHGLTLLINNAGVLNYDIKGLNDTNTEDLIKHFQTNCVAAILVTKALLPALKLGKEKYQRSVVMNITSQMGQISDNEISGHSAFSYRISKTALNMATKCMSMELKPDGIEVYSFCPGWVRTDMGGPQGHIDPPESIEGMIKTVSNLDITHTGKFYKYHGANMKW